MYFQSWYTSPSAPLSTCFSSFLFLCFAFIQRDQKLCQKEETPREPYRSVCTIFLEVTTVPRSEFGGKAVGTAVTIESKLIGPV